MLGEQMPFPDGLFLPSTLMMIPLRNTGGFAPLISRSMPRPTYGVPTHYAHPFVSNPTSVNPRQGQAGRSIDRQLSQAQAHPLPRLCAPKLWQRRVIAGAAASDSVAARYESVLFLIYMHPIKAHCLPFQIQKRLCCARREPIEGGW